MFLHTGIVERGTGRATALGFPTINIPFDNAGITGIYAGRVIIEETSYPAAIYVDQRRHLLEAHLLDFSGELYGSKVGIELHQKLREDAKFDDEASLRAAIADDIQKARRYFGL